jgi:hypothetical protein
LAFRYEFVVLQGELKMCAGSFANSEYMRVLLKDKPDFLLCALFEKTLMFF